MSNTLYMLPVILPLFAALLLQERLMAGEFADMNTQEFSKSFIAYQITNVANRTYTVTHTTRDYDRKSNQVFGLSFDGTIAYKLRTDSDAKARNYNAFNAKAVIMHVGTNSQSSEKASTNYLPIDIWNRGGVRNSPDTDKIVKGILSHSDDAWALSKLFGSFPVIFPPLYSDKSEEATEGHAIRWTVTNPGALPLTYTAKRAEDNTNAFIIKSRSLMQIPPDMLEPEDPNNPSQSGPSFKNMKSIETTTLSRLENGYVRSGMMEVRTRYLGGYERVEETSFSCSEK